MLMQNFRLLVILPVVFRIFPVLALKLWRLYLSFLVAKTTPNCLVAIVTLILAYAFWFVKRGC